MDSRQRQKEPPCKAWSDIPKKKNLNKNVDDADSDYEQQLDSNDSDSDMDSENSKMDTFPNLGTPVSPMSEESLIKESDQDHGLTQEPHSPAESPIAQPSYQMDMCSALGTPVSPLSEGQKETSLGSAIMKSGLGSFTTELNQLDSGSPSNQDHWLTQEPNSPAKSPITQPSYQMDMCSALGTPVAPMSEGNKESSLGSAVMRSGPLDLSISSDQHHCLKAPLSPAESPIAQPSLHTQGSSSHETEQHSNNAPSSPMSREVSREVKSPPRPLDLSVHTKEDIYSPRERYSPTKSFITESSVRNDNSEDQNSDKDFDAEHINNRQQIQDLCVHSPSSSSVQSRTPENHTALGLDVAALVEQNHLKPMLDQLGNKAKIVFASRAFRGTPEEAAELFREIVKRRPAGIKKQYVRSTRDCPICNKDVLNVPRHLRESHKKSSRTAKKLSKVVKKMSLSRRPKTLSACTVDGCPAVVQRLDNHLQQVHKISRRTKRFMTLMHAERKMDWSGGEEGENEYEDQPSKDDIPSKEDEQPKNHSPMSPVPSSENIKPSQQQEIPISIPDSPSQSIPSTDEYEDFKRYLKNAMGLKKNEQAAKQHVAQVKKVMDSIKGSDLSTKLQPKNFNNLENKGYLHQLLNMHRMPGTVKSYLSSLKLYLQHLKLEGIICEDTADRNMLRIQTWYASFKDMMARRKQD